MRGGGALGLKVALSAIGILCAASLATGFIFARMWADATVDAKGEVKNIASILAEQTFQSVKSLDLVLEDLIDRVSMLDPVNPGRFSN